MSDGNPIRTAIREHLIANTDLTDLLSSEDSVYYQVAPSSAVLPFVIFQEQTDGSNLHAMDGHPLETVDWFIKGVGSVSKAEDIYKQIKVSMDRATLTIPGYENQLCMRQRNVSYPEVEDGTRYQHTGAVYKITTEEET